MTEHSTEALLDSPQDLRSDDQSGAKLYTDDTMESGDLASMQATLAMLIEHGINRFDPVRFCYIESMIHRAVAQRKPVADALAERAGTALGEYQADFNRAKSDAALIVSRTIAEAPESSKQLAELFEACDFKGVARLAERLKRKQQSGPLAALLSQLLQHESTTTATSSNGLLSPEAHQMPSFSLSGELKSLQLFRESWGKRYAEKRIRQVIDNAPENPGPLNPEMLVVRSLTSMRDLSPSYINRFITYLDTLNWLEQAGEEIQSDKSKKGDSKPKSKGAGNRPNR